MIKKILLPLLFAVSCTTMKTKVVTQEDGKIRLSTYEDSLFSETDKAVVILSSKNSGQIEKISWNGLELLKSPIVEKFPSPDLNFQKLKTNISSFRSNLTIYMILRTLMPK